MAGTQSHTRDQLLGLISRDGWPLGQTATKPPDRSGRSLQVRLSPADVARMIADYEAGARTTDLARRYGVHRNTVQRVLKANAVALRQVSSLPDH